MPTEVIRNTISLKATASLVASGQYRFVKLDASGQIVLATEGSNAIGVVQDKPAAGEPGSVALTGSVSKVYCGGSFNPGDYVGADANGNAIGVDTGDFVLGQALTVGANLTVASILFQPRGGTA
jgi:hypothetical protein